MGQLYVKIVNIFTGNSENALSSELKPLEWFYFFIIPLLVVASSMLVKITGVYYIDSDQFWSLAVGQWIVENGAVPTVDTFSWTVEGLPWRSNSWLFCWLLYMVDYYWGMYGVAIMLSMVYLVTAYILLAMCLRLNKANISVWIFAIGMWTLVYFSATPRAYIFTFAFVIAIFYLIRFKRDTRLIYLIPLIFLLWVNIQTSVRFGLALLFVEALIGTVFYKDRRLWPVLALSFLATLANPYGLSIWEMSVAGAVAPGTKYITEWKAPDFDHTSIFLRYLIAGLTAGIASYGAVFSYYKTKIIDRDELMVFFWFWAMFLYALTMVRASHYMLLLWIPYLALFTPQWLKDRMRLKPILILGILAIFVGFIYFNLPKLPMFRAPHAVVPAGAVEYLLENPDLQENMYNDYIFGGFLLANGIKVFIDARESIYTREGVMADYMDIQNLKVKPQVVIDKYDIKSFVIRTGVPLTIYLDTHPDWEAVYFDRTSVIFKNTAD